MRAARALDMLLILQRRGRTSARELASELEVSERTILRDVEVLSEAGVPVLTVQGAHGGIELLDGFETQLTGLTTDEALTLLLIGQPRVAHRLGLAAPARRSRSKLLTSIPDPLAQQADELSQWFLHDPDPWSGHQIPHGELRRISTSIRRQRRVELYMSASTEGLSVRPLGLVLKAGSWLLVHAAEAIEVVSLDGLRSTRLTMTSFTPPEGFDLDSFWVTHIAAAQLTAHDVDSDSQQEAPR